MTNKQMSNKQIIYALCIMLITNLLLTITAVVVSVSLSTSKAKETDDTSNRRWCTLLVGIDTIYSTTPPTTDTGRQFAAGIHQLAVDFNCKG